MKLGEDRIRPSSSARWMTLELPVETTALRGERIEECVPSDKNRFLEASRPETDPKCQKATAMVRAEVVQKAA